MKYVVSWADTLLYGDYKQGMINLRDKEDRYCCLGVLCELYPDVEFVDTYSTAPYAVLDGKVLTSAIPPENVNEEAGLNEKLKWYEAVLLQNNGIQVTSEATRLTALTLMNDSGLMNFKKIGAIIKLLRWDVVIDD